MFGEDAILSGTRGKTDAYETQVMVSDLLSTSDFNRGIGTLAMAAALVVAAGHRVGDGQRGRDDLPGSLIYSSHGDGRVAQSVDITSQS